MIVNTDHYRSALEGRNLGAAAVQEWTNQLPLVIFEIQPRCDGPKGPCRVPQGPLRQVSGHRPPRTVTYWRVRQGLSRRGIMNQHT
jgi:hypothetical protein